MVNILVMGWINLGMAKILEGTLGIDKWQAIIVCLVVTFVYTVVSGFWGVAATDTMQYFFEMGGAILLAIVAVNAVGGMDAMKAKLGAAHPAGSPPGTTFGSAEAVLSFWPTGRGLGRPRHHAGHAAHRELVGLVVSRARSRAAEATSRRTCSPARRSGTAATPSSSSTSRTTRCAAGRG